MLRLGTLGLGDLSLMLFFWIHVLDLIASLFLASLSFPLSEFITSRREGVLPFWA